MNLLEKRQKALELRKKGFKYTDINKLLKTCSFYLIFNYKTTTKCKECGKEFPNLRRAELTCPVCKEKKKIRFCIKCGTILKKSERICRECLKKVRADRYIKYLESLRLQPKRPCLKCGTLATFGPKQKAYCNDCLKEIHNFIHKGRDFSRNRVRERDNFICQKCGFKWKKGLRRLDCHHLEENGSSKKYDKDPSKLITLCHSCHMKLHQKYGWGNLIPISEFKKLSTV